MKTIYLHCGAPKTGTSYLQTLFALYVKELSEDGIIYPFNRFVLGAKQGKITSGNGIPMANYIRPNLPHQIPNKGIYLEEFKMQLKDAQAKDLLFSSEFLTFPNNDKTKGIVDAIYQEDYQVKVIYLVRDFGKAAYSTYSQEIKRAGEFRNFSTFIRSWDPLYINNIRTLRKIFGDQSVFVYNYEEHANNLQSLFFKDFLKTKINIEHKSTVNRSLSQSEIKMMRYFNEITGGDAKSSNFVNDALMLLPATLNKANQLQPLEYDYLAMMFSKAIDEINSFIIGEKIKIGTVSDQPNAELTINDSERLTLAILAKLVQKATKA